MTDNPDTASHDGMPMRRYHLRHLTTYQYSEAASIAHHDLCLQLRALPYQDVRFSRVSVEPAPDSFDPRMDTFGNWRHFVAIERSHEALVVLAEATIDVHERIVPALLTTPPWEDIRAAVDGYGFPEHAEPLQFILPSPGVALVPEVTEYARQSFAPGRPVLEAVAELNRRIYEDFTYEPGATAVSTPVAEAFASRQGVCQDFAQIAIAGLRGIGLAARYVSGYIRTTGTTQSQPEPANDAPPPVSPASAGRPRPRAAADQPAAPKTSLPVSDAALRGADASHAWFSVWCGPEHGWVDLDPTNNLIVGTDHVVIGWGRDYLDIAPVKGVILGGGTQELSVAVDLIPDKAATLSDNQPVAS